MGIEWVILLINLAVISTAPRLAAMRYVEEVIHRRRVDWDEWSPNMSHGIADTYKDISVCGYVEIRKNFTGCSVAYRVESARYAETRIQPGNVGSTEPFI